jgi:tape measure domain-containing protein
MATVAELLVRIGGDSSGLRREINNSQRQLRRAFGPEALELSEGAAGLLGALAVAMGAVGIASVGMSSKLNQARSAFEVLLESGDKANKMVSDLQAYATATSFNFEGLSSTAKSMLAVGIEGQDVLPIIASVGDAIGTLGGGTEALQGVIRALSQIQAKGKLSAEEMNQLAERGIPGWRYLAESMGKSTAEVMKMTSDGAINSTTAINAIVGGMATQFKGGAEKANNEMTGQFESMKETVINIMAQIGDSITKTFDLKNVFSRLNDSLSQFSSAVQSSGVKTAILGLVPPEATAAVFALGGALLMVAVPALYTFAGAMWLAIAPMAPYIALGTAIGLLAYEIWKNWEPMSDLFGGMWNLISNRTVMFLNDLQSSFYRTISRVMGYLTPLANLFGGTFQATISNWGDNATNQLERLSASSKDSRTKIESNLGVIKNAWNKTAVGLKSMDIAGLMPGGQGKPNTTFTGLHGNGAGNQMADKAGEAAAKKAEKAWEQLEKKADQVSRSIEKEWIQLTGTQIDALDNWKKYELKTLNESKDANENYENDLIRLDQIYAEKKKKILYDQLKDTNRIWDSAKADAQEYQDKLAQIGLTGVDKQKFEINDSASDEIDKMLNKYRDLKAEYENGTKAQQEEFRKAWTANGIQFELTENGMVNFQKQTAANQLIIEKDKNQKLKDLHYERVKYQEDLDKAYDEGDLARFKEVLNSKQALLERDIEGQQAMADLYKTVWSDAHMSMTEVIAGIGDVAYDGLKTGLADILKGTKSISEAWSALGSTIGNVIADMAAKWIAAQIAMAIFGKSSQAATGSTAAAGGATVASAWAPAAAMVSLATFGANAGPAMTGIALTTGLAELLSGIGGKATGGEIIGPGTGTSDSILSWLSNGEYVIKASAVKALGIDALNTLNTGRMPAFATGGLVTGASLSTIGSGYSRSNSAVNNAGKSDNNQTQQNQPIQENHLHLHTLDGKSTEKWLHNGGGKAISKFMGNQARSFGMGV